MKKEHIDHYVSLSYLLPATLYECGKNALIEGVRLCLLDLDPLLCSENERRTG